MVTENLLSCSVQFSHSVISNSLRPHESQHARPPCPWPTPGVYSNRTVIESVMPSSHLILCHPLLLLPPIPPSIRVFLLFAWGGQSTGVSASASVLPMNTQDWSPLGWTGWISLQSWIIPTGTVYKIETSAPLESLSSRILQGHRSQTSDVLSQ